MPKYTFNLRIQNVDIQMEKCGENWKNLRKYLQIGQNFEGLDLLKWSYIYYKYNLFEKWQKMGLKKIEGPLQEKIHF